MEIWIASVTPENDTKNLKRKFTFLKDFGVIDTIEIAKGLGYTTTKNLNCFANFLISNEVKNQLLVKNKSKRFYRILVVVEELSEDLSEILLNFSEEHKLKYEKVYVLEGEEFVLKNELCK